MPQRPQRGEDQPEQQPGHREKADQIAREGINVRRELGKRAEQAQDPGGTPDEHGAPAGEQ